MIAPWLVFLAPATAFPFPELARLQPIVGTWKSDQVISHCDWSPERRWVVCDQHGSADGKPVDAISLYGYSPARKAYVFFTEPDGATQPWSARLRIEGNTWTYLPATDDKPRFKTTNEFVAPDHYLWKVWRSPDGKTWSVVKNGTSTRVP